MASRAWYDFMTVCTGASASEGTSLAHAPNDPSSWCNNKEPPSHLAQRDDFLRAMPELQRKLKRASLRAEEAANSATENQPEANGSGKSWIPEYILQEIPDEVYRSRDEDTRRPDQERRRREDLLKHNRKAQVPMPSTRSLASDTNEATPEAGRDPRVDGKHSRSSSLMNRVHADSQQQDSKRSSKEDKSRKLPPAPKATPSSVPLWQPAHARAGSNERRRTPPPVPVSVNGETSAQEGRRVVWDQPGEEPLHHAQAERMGDGHGEQSMMEHGEDEHWTSVDATEEDAGWAQPHQGHVAEGEVTANGHEGLPMTVDDDVDDDQEEVIVDEVAAEAEARPTAQSASPEGSESNGGLQPTVSDEAEEYGDDEEGRWECVHKHPQSFGRSGRVPALVALSASGAIHVSFPSRSFDSFGPRKEAPGLYSPPFAQTSTLAEPPPPTTSNQHTNKGTASRKSWLPSFNSKDSPRRRSSKLSSGAGPGRRRSQSWATRGLAEVRFHCSDLVDASHKFLGPSEGGAVKLVFRSACKLKLEGPAAERILAAVQAKAPLAARRRKFQGERLLHLRRLARTQVSWSDAEHRADLQRLWGGVFTVDMPEGSLQMEVSPGWKDMGFQSNDPCTDFRAMGRLSLGCLSYMVRHFKARAARIVVDGTPKRDYPFGAVGVNIVAGLMGLLGLGVSDVEVSGWEHVPDSDLLALLCRLPRRTRPRPSSLNTATAHAAFSPSPSTVASSRPTPRGSVDEAGGEGSCGSGGGKYAFGDGVEGDGMTEGFEEVFCATFELLDAIWVRDRPANILYFNSVLDRTWDCLKQALASPHILSIADLRDQLRIMVPPPAEDEPGAQQGPAA